LMVMRKMQAPTRHCDAKQGLVGKVQRGFSCGIYAAEKLKTSILQQLICLTSLI